VNEKEKLILAQMQVNNLLTLLSGNPYENYICGKLYGINYELNRQLTNINHSGNITKENRNDQ